MRALRHTDGPLETCIRAGTIRFLAGQRHLIAEPMQIGQPLVLGSMFDSGKTTFELRIELDVISRRQQDFCQVAKDELPDPFRRSRQRLMSLLHRGDVNFGSVRT